MQMCAAILKWNSKGEKHLSFAYTEEGLVTFLLWTLPRKVDTQFWSFFLRGIFILKTFTFQIEIQHSSGWNQNVCVLHKYHQKLLFCSHFRLISPEIKLYWKTWGSLLNNTNSVHRFRLCCSFYKAEFQVWQKY